MGQRTIQILFALLRSAICGTNLTEDERNIYSPDMLQDLLKISSKHDVVHLVVLGLKRNDLMPQENIGIEKYIFRAVYRYERINYELERICLSLEEAKIPFVPLKGAVLRAYYPEPWMRTSCDIDILVHQYDLDRTINYLSNNLQYALKDRSTHDVSLYTSQNVHVELHFSLTDGGRATVLNQVWDNVVLHENKRFWYEMNDDFFCFYHIAHMAQHFETGGCGIKPFMDLFFLEDKNGLALNTHNDLFLQGGLLLFAENSLKLSNVWFKGREADKITSQMQEFIMNGGVYGSINNRVMLQQKRQGGRIGYVLSRIFIPYVKLKGYYPVLEKHRWLMPIMQIRRWFMLLKPDVARMAKKEMAVNKKIERTEANVMNDFLESIGLN